MKYSSLYPAGQEDSIKTTFHVVTKIIIITDLDGTLLHPMSYSPDEARPALELIKTQEIPLILCSSKTRAEIEAYRERLENRDPFISENGGGVFIPEGYFDFPVEGELRNGYRVFTLGKPYGEIRKVFREVQARTGIRARGFGDMDAREVACLTGMQLSDARLARQRDFDEPFIFEEGEKRIEEFLCAIEAAGLHWTRGKFYHILGDHDKGKAVDILKMYYKRACGEIKTIGLGDNLNDLPLLQKVDYPVLVQKEDGSYEERINLPGLIRAEGIGPKGWNWSVIMLIDTMNKGS